MQKTWLGSNVREHGPFVTVRWMTTSPSEIADNHVSSPARTWRGEDVSRLSTEIHDRVIKAIRALEPNPARQVAASWLAARMIGASESAIIACCMRLLTRFALCGSTVFAIAVRFTVDRLTKEHNPIRIRPFEIVIHAPAVRGLGEYLIVYEDEQRFQSGGDSSRQYGILQFRFSAVNFATSKAT